ncbi:MAG TPA: pitrilysin family protein [Chthoniobacterales bacterium]
MRTQVTKLANGVRVASCPMPHVQSVAVGVWAAVGGRHESRRLNGISHFIEHLLFKGTARRSARRIMQEIEGIGGDINANTAEERTCYYASAPHEYLPQVLDVLTDLYRHPRFSPADIELERGVIHEEIQMYLDEPSQHVLELLHEKFWPGQAIGRALTGTAESIAKFTREDFAGYLGKHYQGAATIVTAAGNLDHGRLVESVEKSLGGLVPGKRPASPPARSLLSGPELHVVTRETQQTHVAVGLPGTSYRDPDRFAANLLHVMLGGNASSRLFQELREKHGYCYSISTYPLFFSDTGMLNLSIGLDARNLAKAFQLIGRQFARIREQLGSPAELKRAKEYTIGLSRMSMERTSSQSSRIGQSLLAFGRVVDPEEIYAKIRAVTPDDIRRVAGKLLGPEGACAVIIGPVKRDESLMRALMGK